MILYVYLLCFVVIAVTIIVGIRIYKNALLDAEKERESDAILLDPYLTGTNGSETKHVSIVDASIYKEIPLITIAQISLKVKRNNYFESITQDAFNNDNLHRSKTFKQNKAISLYITNRGTSMDLLKTIIVPAGHAFSSYNTDDRIVHDYKFKLVGDYNE